MSTPDAGIPDLLERRGEILAPLDKAQHSTFLRLVQDPANRVVVSFGGGSVPGLCGNVALARILEELEVLPHVAEVWGTSAGAAVGGPWATGTEAAAIYEAIRSLDRRGAIDLSWPRVAAAILMRPFRPHLPDGLIRGRPFAETVDRTLRVKTFEECPVPFRCIACTDDGRAQRKVFRRGPLLPAIFSNMSLPGIVAPRPREPGETSGFYDGGLVEKTPLLSPVADHARTGDARKLLLIGTHYGNDARRTPARGFINRFLHSIYALESHLWEYQLAEARGRPNLLLMLLNPHIDDPRMFDFGRVERNYLQARQHFRDILQNAKLALSFGSE